MFKVGVTSFLDHRAEIHLRWTSSHKLSLFHTLDTRQNNDEGNLLAVFWNCCCRFSGETTSEFLSAIAVLLFKQYSLKNVMYLWTLLHPCVTFNLTLTLFHRSNRYKRSVKPKPGATACGQNDRIFYVQMKTVGYKKKIRKLKQDSKIRLSKLTSGRYKTSDK